MNKRLKQGLGFILSATILGCSGMKNAAVRKIETLPDTIEVSDYNYIPLFKTIYNHCGKAELGRKDINNEEIVEDYVCGGDSVFFVNYRGVKRLEYWVRTKIK